MRQTSLFDQRLEPSTVVLTGASTADTARRVLARIDVPGGGQASVVTSGLLAARALGVRHRSLTDVARQILSRQGLRFANVITRRTALRDAIEDVWGSSDPVGAARAVHATV